MLHVSLCAREIRRPPVKSRRTIVFVAAVLVAVLLFAVPVLAGNGKGKGKAEPTLVVQAMSSTETALLSVFGPVEFQVSGDGYRSGAPVFIVFDRDLPSLLVQAGKAGSISTTWTSDVPGTYTLTSYQLLRNGNWVVGAQTVVEVK